MQYWLGFRNPAERCKRKEAESWWWCREQKWSCVIW